MPPILLLKGDKQFYGELKPKGTGSADLLKKPAPPPDPVTDVPLTNEAQRENRLTENIKDPYSREERKGESIEKDVKDVEKLKSSNDLGSRFVSFLQTPIVDVDEVSAKNQKQRELSRIGVAPEPVTNDVRPIGEVPINLGNRVVNFIEKEFFKVILLAGGIYLAGQFIQGVGVGTTSTKKKNNPVGESYSD
tara:strand:- start:314 stop:889 length:576 start_codon:yes stop_codon:yes gene_type:complete